MSKKRVPEEVSGRYVPLPHSVLDAPAFASCSCMAKSLLLELLRQHNGSNNGHIRLSRGWLTKRGWNSVSSIVSARRELIRSRLIVQTRHGGLRNGSHLFALTWLPITNFVGLDIGRAEYHPGAYLLPIPPTPKKNGCPSHGHGKRASCPSERPSGFDLCPSHRPESVLFGRSPSPPHGHKLINHSPLADSWVLPGGKWRALGEASPCDARSTT